MLAASLATRSTTLALLCTFVIAIVLYSGFSRPSPASSSSHAYSKTSHANPIPKTKGTSAHLGNWEYKYEDHATQATLNHAQCDKAFSPLFKPIEDEVKRRNGTKVSAADLHIEPGRCMLRVMIFDNEVYVIDDGAAERCFIPTWPERVTGLLSAIHRAVVSSTEPIPNIEFSASYDDSPRRDTANVTWGMAYNSAQGETGVWLMPDYAYWGWPSVGLAGYNQVRRRIEMVNRGNADQTGGALGPLMPWGHKEKRAVWRGNLASSPELRRKLMDASRGKEWSDVQAWRGGPTDDQESNGDEVGAYLPTEQLCRYQFTIQTEGFSYSGRLKYLLLCNSVLISHKLDWIELHTHLLNPSGPQQNFIEVERDWSDLENAMSHATNFHNAPEMEAIASRSYNMFAQRYLTPAAIECYWRRLFDAWATVQDYEPTLYEKDADGVLKLRGEPFEQFISTFSVRRMSERGVATRSDEGRDARHKPES